MIHSENRANRPKSGIVVNPSWLRQAAEESKRMAPPDVLDKRPVIFSPCAVPRPKVSDLTIDLLVQRNGLIDEHDGNVVLDLVLQATGMANQPVFRLRENQVSLALRTDKYFQQSFAYRHGSPCNVRRRGVAEQGFTAWDSFAKTSLPSQTAPQGYITMGISAQGRETAQHENPWRGVPKSMCLSLS
jgi:hypothetical protein